MKPYEIIADQMDFLFNAAKRLAEKEIRMEVCSHCQKKVSQFVTVGDEVLCEECNCAMEARQMCLQDN